MSKIIVRNISELAQEPVGEMVRQLIFSPGAVGNPRLRVALNLAEPGAAASGHTHPGEEIIITLEGSATLHMGSESVELVPWSAVMIPPGAKHHAVASSRGWKALAIFCDECPLLNRK